jgi:hypothetical protein
MVWPQVWIEDESYLNGAFLLATGHAPYTGFPLPHFPLLEGSLAALLEIFPTAIRTAEAFTAAAAWVSSIFVWRIGRRLGGEVCGVAAALIFATSPLLFRYHVFEREVFLVVPVLAASWLVLRWPGTGERTETRTIVIAGVLLAIAMAIKLTAASYVAALFLFILLVNRQRDRAVVFLGTVVVVMGISTGALWALFGTPFLVQVVLFRLVHAGFHSLTGQFHEWLGSLDVELAAGAAGFALVLWQHRLRRWALPLLHLAFGFVLLVVLNPTFWAHDSIELLPWLALLGGVLVADLAMAFGRHTRDAPSRPAAVAALVGAVLLFVIVVPLPHANWGPGAGSGFGFGYRDRAEIDRVAAYVRSKTAPGALVAMPPILAFQANRPELITYPELAGTMMTLGREVKAKGFATTLKTSEVGQRMFWDEVAASRDVWLPDLAEAIQARRLGAVINFSPADLFPVPLIDVPDQALRAAGYVPGLVTEHYTVWTVGGS